MRLPLLLAAVFAVAVAEQQQPPVRTLVVDVNIGGPDEARDNYTFPFISGAAFDKSGRILIADGKDNTVRVFDTTGKYAFRFGQTGQGPGDLKNALSGVFSPDGLFWVRDEENSRWSAFELRPDRALPRMTVRYDHDRAYDRLNPVGFDAAGNLVSSGTVRDTGMMMRTRVPVRVTLDRAGKVIRSDTIFLPRGDSLGDYTLTKPIKRGGVIAGAESQFYYQPYGSKLIIAYAPNGEYARVVSSRYDIEWRSADNKLLRHVRRDVAGPALSAREKQVGQETVDGFLKRSGMSASDLPHGVPERKAPVYGMSFDQLGRLWVSRAVPDGEPREADLYDASGKWIAIVRWPREMNPLAFGMVPARGDRVLAVTRDSDQVEWVVRMRMK